MKPTLKRFNKLTPSDINFDFHIHTSQTDGSSSPEQIIESAQRLNLRAIAFTEHVNRNSTWFPAFQERIKSLASQHSSPIIYSGIESKVLDFDGTLDATSTMLNTDLVVGVVHRFPRININEPLEPIERFEFPEPMSLNEIRMMPDTQILELEFALSLALITHSDIDVLGHPFSIYSTIAKTFPIYEYRILVSEAIKHAIAIEINTKYLSHPDIDLTLNVLHELNPFVSIGSDAHHCDEVGNGFDYIRNWLEINKKNKEDTIECCE